MDFGARPVSLHGPIRINKLLANLRGNPTLENLDDLQQQNIRLMFIKTILDFVGVEVRNSN